MTTDKFSIESWESSAGLQAEAAWLEILQWVRRDSEGAFSACLKEEIKSGSK